MQTNLEIKTTHFTNEHRTHIDIINPDGTLHVKFDLIDALDSYAFLGKPEKLKLDILAQKQAFKESEVFIPPPELDVLTRYLEYLQYPTKKKHMTYVTHNKPHDWDKLKAKYGINT